MKQFNVLFFIFLVSGVLLAQNNITNTLGTGGLYSIKDATNTFFTLQQSNGFLGIGTTTPGFKLDVNGSINGTSVLVNGVPVASSTDTYWELGGSGSIFYSGGNVGIGTTTPSSKLHIAGADMNNALLFENTSANAGRNYILFKTQGTEQGYIGLGGAATNHMSVAAYGESNNLFLETNGLVRMTVLPSGNVGIGTTTPTSKLQVVGIPEYSDNAAAIAGGLTVGAFYRTGDLLKVVH